MKKLLMISALSACLFSCSLLQRHLGDDESEVQDVEATESADTPLFDANGQEIGSNGAAASPRGGSQDSEVARLNTKIAALETKVEVLSASLERERAEKSQPIIEAEARPQANMAAPVDMGEDIHEQSPHISAAPAKPAPVIVKAMEPAAPNASGAEKEFRASMQLFQNGRNLEAASRFALMAKKFPNHLLAGHALYWAGEASARGQQMGMAADNWLELEKRYPRSAYLPEALAGLAKAYEAQGDIAKAKQYRSLVLNSFSKSPVALRMAPEQQAAPKAARAARAVTHAPAPAAAEDEQAPAFESTEEEGGLTDVENQ